ncbi:uncharacterized protein [Antedon mediterranea]|uniref:uncharacterized protein n=1 Tax=Antedon mediterranea TaxID=105859 RepID=UPI003AF53BB9
MRYSRQKLFDLCRLDFKPPKDFFSVANKLGVARTKARGCRGGRNKVRQIRTLIMIRQSTKSQHTLKIHRVCYSNLIKICPCTPRRQQGPDQNMHSIKVDFPNIFLCNARSIVYRIDELQSLLNVNSSDIAVLTETWQTKQISNDSIAVENYQIYTYHRAHKRGGGVAVYVKDTFYSRIIDTVPNTNCEYECVWVHIRPRRLPRDISGIVVCGVYVPPDGPKNEIMNYLTESVDKLKQKYPNAGYIILGDFNRSKINIICKTHALKQVVNKPTRNDAILDLIITNLSKYYNNPVIQSPIGLSDHNVVVWLPKYYQHKIHRTLKKTNRLMPAHAIQQFGEWITQYPWTEVVNMSNLQEKANAFYSILDVKINKFFPLKSFRLHSSDKSWMNRVVKDLILKRQKCFANEGKSNQWKLYRNRVQLEIKRAKSNFYNEILKSLKSTNPVKWHQGIQLMANKLKPPPIIQIPNIAPNNDLAIAQDINVSFSKVSQSKKSLVRQSLPSFLPAENPPQLEEWEMFYHLKKVKVSKSAGPDNVPNKIIKMFACELSFPLTNIVNASFRQSCVPRQWKDAIVCTIPKEYPIKHDKLRPVSLTSQFAKVAEGIVYDLLLNDIGPNMDTSQYGCMKGCSTSHYLIDMLNLLYKGTDKPRKTGRLVITDFAKAFDGVDHTVAASNLIALGAKSWIVDWICNFFSGRRQRVKYQSTLSDWETLSCGVPQGTKLGEIVFRAAINDAVKEAICEKWKFVDDLSLGEVVNSNATSTLQHDVDDLVEWATMNKFQLNPSKCKQLKFCFMKSPPYMTPININGCELETVNYAKILGVFIQDDLKFDVQVDHILSNGGRRLHMLSLLKQFRIPFEDLAQVYTTYVRPIFEYAIPVWHSSLTVAQTNAIESMQKRACKIILGKDYQDYNTSLNILNIKRLDERRENICRKFATDCITSNKFKDWFIRNPELSVRLKKRKEFVEPLCKTNRYYNSPKLYLTRLLNER